MPGLTLPRISRRAALGSLVSVPAAMVPLIPASAERSSPEARSLVPSCVLTPQSVEGPFYFDPELQRSDITEGRQGVPLAVRLIVVEAGRCVPLAKARVDIWHASAEGHYSGYQGQGDDRAIDTTGQKFLRGSLTTNERGKTLFRTIYPGWYRGRTTHIHFKVFIEERDVLTGQIYFPDALSEYIHANVSHYNARVNRRDTFNSTDGIARMDPAHGGFCDIKEEPEGYLATLIIGADPAATAVADDRGRRLPPGPPPQQSREPAIIVPGVSPSNQRRG